MKNDIEKNLEALKIDKVDKNEDHKDEDKKTVEDTTKEIVKEDKKEEDKVDKEEVVKQDKEEVDKNEVDKEEADKNEVDKVDKEEVDKVDNNEIVKEDKEEVDKKEVDKVDNNEIAKEDKKEIVKEDKKEVDKKEEQKMEGKFNFKNYAKLYRFDKEKNKFFERGEGIVKIELISDNNLYRIMLIRNKINTLACNHYLEPNSHFKQHSIANAYIWQTTTDRVEEEITLQSKYSNRSTVNEREQIYLLRFRKTDSEAAKLFEENFVDATAHNKTVLLAKK